MVGSLCNAQSSLSYRVAVQTCVSEGHCSPYSDAAIKVDTANDPLVPTTTITCPDNLNQYGQATCTLVCDPAKTLPVEIDLLPADRIPLSVYRPPVGPPKKFTIIGCKMTPEGDITLKLYYAYYAEVTAAEKETQKACEKVATCAQNPFDESQIAAATAGQLSGSADSRAAALEYLNAADRLAQLYAQAATSMKADAGIAKASVFYSDIQRAAKVAYLNAIDARANGRTTDFTVPHEGDEPDTDTTLATQKLLQTIIAKSRSGDTNAQKAISAGKVLWNGNVHAGVDQFRAAIAVQESLRSGS